MTLEELRNWINTRPDGGPVSLAARINVGGRNHVGYLSVQGERIFVRNSSASYRNQYQTINDHNLDKLEIKVAARFRPAREVFEAHTSAWEFSGRD